MTKNVFRVPNWTKISILFPLLAQGEWGFGGGVGRASRKKELVHLGILIDIWKRGVKNYSVGNEGLIRA